MLKMKNIYQFKKVPIKSSLLTCRVSSKWVTNSKIMVRRSLAGRYARLDKHISEKVAENGYFSSWQGESLAVINARFDDLEANMAELNTEFIFSDLTVQINDYSVDLWVEKTATKNKREEVAVVGIQKLYSDIIKHRSYARDLKVCGGQGCGSPVRLSNNDILVMPLLLEYSDFSKMSKTVIDLLSQEKIVFC